MAVVYLAVQDLLHRYVAMKVMLPDMAQDENFRKSFLSEGSTIANLEHTHIVRIHDIGITDDSVFYMAMEYLSRGSLREKLGQGRLSYLETVRILEQVAAGLGYAHGKGYIHRDIKPGNILFREDGTAVLSDFGIAKLQDTTGELTRMGFTMGTVQYMSPEQAVTTDLDKRSDIYSLGLVFYEMLTGKKAFLAESTVQAIHQHTTVSPPQLPQEYAFLQPVMDKVLAKNPDERYQTVEHFVEAVKGVEDWDKTVIRSPSVSEKALADDERSTVVNTSIPEKKHPRKQFAAWAKVVGALLLLSVITAGSVQYPGLEDRIDEMWIALFGTSETGETETVATETAGQELLAREKAEAIARQEQLAREKAEEKARQEQLAREKAKAEEKAEAEEKARQEQLAKEKAEAEEKARQEQLAKEKAEAEEKARQEQLAKEKAEAVEKERQKQLAREKTKAEEKARQQQLAREKKINKARKEKERARREHLAKQQEKKEKAQSKTKPDKQAQQPVKNTGFLHIKALLNGRPLKTTFVVTRAGRPFKRFGGKPEIGIEVPVGQYEVRITYAGKAMVRKAHLRRGEVSQVFFRISSSPQATEKIDQKWKHTHPAQGKPAQ